MPKVRYRRAISDVKRGVCSTQPCPSVSGDTPEVNPGAPEVNPGTPEVRELVRKFKVACSSASDGGKEAESMAAYMRNQFKFFGLKAPIRRKLQVTFVRAHTTVLNDRGWLLNFCSALWEEDERELQYFSVDLLREFRNHLLGKGSDEEFWETIRCIERLITTKSWWDTVDALSYPVVGYIVLRAPTLGVQLMRAWIAHDNLWLRRTAILHQLCLKEKTDSKLLFQLCLARASEREFFICKAIGWALRDYSRWNPDAVKEFVHQHRTTLAPLSIKEALRRIL